MKNILDASNWIGKCIFITKNMKIMYQLTKFFSAMKHVTSKFYRAESSYIANLSCHVSSEDLLYTVIQGDDRKPAKLWD